MSANGREPEAKIANIAEFQLYSRLKNLREDLEKVEMLQSEDVHHLFGENDTSIANEPRSSYKKTKKIESIADIFEDDDINIFDDDDMGLFDFKHTPKEDTRASTDFVAKRKPCKDFEKYKTQLQAVQEDLRTGKRTIKDFKQGNLRERCYYLHNGMLFFLEKITITKKDHYKEDGTRVRKDGRTRCIFENGTESNMLKRSVEKILYANGKVISENEDTVAEELSKKMSLISDEDKASGFIYVLQSKSTNPEIASIENLYKIGYSTTDVAERIKNAEKEPTYLMAPVRIIDAFKCYNLNPQKLEQLLHNFFGSSCLEIDVFDSKGKRFTPREWFIAPIEIIQEAIELIITGKIIGKVYDAEFNDIINSKN